MNVDHLDIWAAAYAEASRQIAELTEQRDHIKAQLVELLGDLEEANTRGGYRVTYKTVTSTRLDTKKVRGILEAAGALDACTISSTSRRLTVVGPEAGQ